MRWPVHRQQTGTLRLVLNASCIAVLSIASRAADDTFYPSVPRAWDDKDVQGFELPLAEPDRSARYMTADEYYKLKARTIYRSYPVYVQGKEPPGYIEALKLKEPEVIFDSSRLRTKEDWIKAGKIVFEAQNTFSPADATPGGQKLRPEDARWVSGEGAFRNISTGTRYIIRKKGILEIGSNACAACHTRLMPDGSIIEGAQGNFAFGQVQTPAAMTPDRRARWLDRLWVNFGAPWIQTRAEFEESMMRLGPVAEDYPTVYWRQGTSPSHPVRIPSLIGIQDIRYLDATGLVRHRSIGDLMRYAIINLGLDTLAFFGDFQPSPHANLFSAEEGTRFSDEQLYALALYLYSLRPPANPNSVGDPSRRGEQVFLREGCAVCHTPPLYTNNKLTLAVGFTVPHDLRRTEDILDLSVGSDPTLAMRTRRGTGFYKVPSLRGVWFRNGFGHGGQANTLEEWFDPARLKDGYVPKGYHREPGPIKGHEFGLALGMQEREDLIAFLKTL